MFEFNGKKVFYGDDEYSSWTLSLRPEERDKEDVYLFYKDSRIDELYSLDRLCNESPVLGDRLELIMFVDLSYNGPQFFEILRKDTTTLYQEIFNRDGGIDNTFWKIPYGDECFLFEMKGLVSILTYLGLPIMTEKQYEDYLKLIADYKNARAKYFPQELIEQVRERIKTYENR